MTTQGGSRSRSNTRNQSLNSPGIKSGGQSQLNQQSSHRLMLNAVAASGQFIVEHAYSYLKHQRLELTHKYECSDVIILPKNVFQLMDEPKYVELSAVKQMHVNSNEGATPPTQGQFRTISNSIMKG